MVFWFIFIFLILITTGYYVAGKSYLVRLKESQNHSKKDSKEKEPVQENKIEQLAFDFDGPLEIDRIQMIQKSNDLNVYQQRRIKYQEEYAVLSGKISNPKNGVLTNESNELKEYAGAFD